MTDKIDSSKLKQIKILLSVLCSGLCFGLLMALICLYWYNPNGSYQANNVLLDPDNAYNLRYADPGPKGKSEGKYIFEGMYFTYFDANTKQQVTIPIAKDRYKNFYYLISKDSSIVEPNNEIMTLFNLKYPAFLVLKVRPIGNDLSKGLESTFSRVEFVNNGDDYRIQLRQSARGAEWTYFHHPKIYQEAYKILSQSHD